MIAVRRRSLGLGLAVALLVALPSGAALLLAKEPASGGSGLWISADRIVGFVPFTVYVYGRLQGSEPGDLELCRSEIAWITESTSADAGPGGPSSGGGAQRRIGDDAACSKGRMERTPDGFYRYRQDMRFDRPGVYHVRLMLVDGTGHRLVSNTLRVSAF